MFIGVAKIDLINHNVYEKQYTIKKGQRFLARSGIMYNEYRAEMIDILKTVNTRDDDYLDGCYLELENDSNREYIDVELHGEDAESYKQLKAQNEALKKENEELKVSQVENVERAEPKVDMKADEEPKVSKEVKKTTRSKK